MKIYHQSTFDIWPIENNSVQAIITSPPYYSLRKYNIPDMVIGGKQDCEHNWDIDNIYSQGMTCISCCAWKGQYGLEPSYKDYIEHTVLWAKEAWRVLRDDGVFFLNIGDSFCSGGGASRHKGYSDTKYPNGRNGEFAEPSAFPQQGIKPKCKM